MKNGFLDKKIDRRSFIESCVKGACALGISSALLKSQTALASLDVIDFNSQPNNSKQDSNLKYIKEASHYIKLGDNIAQCQLCPRNCVVPPQGRGLCGVRENRGGVYYTLVHSRVCAYHIDPIEKKPLFHYKPSANAFSLATPGCNISCKFCQNWQISQAKPEEISCQYMNPKDIVAKAKESNASCIAYTYSEPTIFYEFMYDTAKLGNENGVKSVIISNGFIAQKPQEELLNQLDAVKIDLKGFTEGFYKNICNGELKPVLESIKRVKNKGKWLELVVLIIPTLNDSDKEITGMASWVSNELGNDVPIHFTRFHPDYKLRNLPITPVSTLENCVRISKANGLKYAYIGNVPGHPSENTYCPSCSKTVIKRYGFYVLENNIKNGVCSFCQTKIAGVFA